MIAGERYRLFEVRNRVDPLFAFGKQGCEQRMCVRILAIGCQRVPGHSFGVRVAPGFQE